MERIVTMVMGGLAGWAARWVAGWWGVAGLAALPVGSVFAQEAPVGSGEWRARIDTVAVNQVAEGVVHLELVAPEVPWTLDVVEVDLRHPGYRLEMVKARDRLRGYERTSSMAGRFPCQEGSVAAAVNGDFYGSGGVPVNLHVGAGRVLRPPMARDLMLHSDGMGFHMGQVAMRSSMWFGEMEVPLDSLNGFALPRRDEDGDGDGDGGRPGSDLVGEVGEGGAGTLHLEDGGQVASDGPGSVGQEREGAEDGVETVAGVRSMSRVILAPAGPLGANRRVSLRVASTPWSPVAGETGPSRIPERSFVLTGSGGRAALVQALRPGERILLEHRLMPTDGRTLPGDGTVTVAVGGSRVFVLKGESRGNWPERHPRTAVGFNADTTRFYMVTVDGRQESSVGMTLTELAEVMKAMGVWTALNLDGGGSTTMVVDGRVVNSPSDRTGERTVANALLLVRRATGRGGSGTVGVGTCLEAQDAGRGGLDP